MRPVGTILAVALSLGCDDDPSPADAGGHDAPSLDAGADAKDASDASICASPLSADVLQALVISFEPTISLQPGQSFQFETAVVECCYFLDPIEACTTWSVSPAEGAAISQTGLLEIDATTLHGATYSVTADVENGRRLISATVHVYTTEGNPLVGSWIEVTQFECGSGTEAAPEQAIGELRFKADGTFGVTWMPFEVYVDYWGAYAHEVTGGTLTLIVDGGNYVPPDVDGTGGFSIDGGDLLLHGIWLGTPQGGSAPPRCGHRFAR